MTFEPAGKPVSAGDSSAGFAGARTGVSGALGAPDDDRSTQRGPYSDVIRRRWRHPRFRGEVAGANAVAEDVNPLCGDRVRMQLRIDDSRVTAAGFVGDSCAICTASADVLSELVSGKPVEGAAAFEVGSVLDVLDADIRPTRMRCVTLPISVLRAALASYGATR